MIIRSQDKKQIVNFDVCHLSITADHCIVATNGVVSYPSEILSGVIGRYSTEEKAIKVLDMICEHAEALHFSKVAPNECGQIWGNVFNMPQDSEV